MIAFIEKLTNRRENARERYRSLILKAAKNNGDLSDTDTAALEDCLSRLGISEQRAHDQVAALIALPQAQKEASDLAVAEAELSTAQTAITNARTEKRRFEESERGTLKNQGQTVNATMIDAAEKRIIESNRKYDRIIRGELEPKYRAASSRAEKARRAAATVARVKALCADVLEGAA